MAQDRRGVVVDRVTGDVTVRGAYRLGHAAEEQSGQVERMAAQVDESAAAGFVGVEEMAGQPAPPDRAVVRQPAADLRHLAEPAGREHLPDRERVAVRQPRQRDAQLDPVRLTASTICSRVGGRQGQDLLREDVLAGLGGGEITSGWALVRVVTTTASTSERARSSPRSAWNSAPSSSARGSPRAASSSHAATIFVSGLAWASAA